MLGEAADQLWGQCQSSGQAWRDSSDHCIMSGIYRGGSLFLGSCFQFMNYLYISDSDCLAGVLGCGHQHKDAGGLDSAGGRGGQGAPRAGEEPPQASRHRCQCQRQPE